MAFSAPLAERDVSAELLACAAAVAERCAELGAASDRDAFPAQEFALLAEAGLLVAPLPPELGGLGLGSAPGSTALLLDLLRRIGRGSLPVGRIYEGHVNALLLILRYGTSAQIEAYAADVREHGHIFGVWNTDAEQGVTITPVAENRYRLAGTKNFCSGANRVTRPFVNGKLPDGRWQMCVVPMEQVSTVQDPSWWQAEGMRGSVSYRTNFDGVEVDQHALVGAPGDYTTEPMFSGGAIRFAAVQLGGAEALFDAMRTFLRGGGRTEDPFQRVRAGEASIALESAIGLLERAAQLADRSDAPSAQVVAYAHLARSSVERVCLEVLQLVDRSVGARGLLRPHPMERIGRDLRLYLRQPAVDAVLVQLGKHVLEDPKPFYALWD